MRTVTSLVTLFAAALYIISPGLGAEVLILINKTTQRMSVTVDGAERYSWPVSTGLADYATPTGAFTPSRLVKDHYSKEWDDAPMPHSIFFTDSKSNGARPAQIVASPFHNSSLPSWS
jgi:lipoprotein-anchoring transpeptidase ErfK/SrfK